MYKGNLYSRLRFGAATLFLFKVNSKHSCSEGNVQPETAY